MKVLVVDDSQLIRKIITANLISLGIAKENIHEAIDGEMAYRNAPRIKELGMMITDIAMPKIDGCKLIGMMREDERFRELSIVVISGTLDEENKQKLDELKVDCFLPKPFNKEKFIEIMNPLLNDAMSGKNSKAKQDSDENKRLVLEALGRSVKEARVERFDLVLEFEESEIYIDLDEFLKLATYKPKHRSIESKEKREEQKAS